MGFYVPERVVVFAAHCDDIEVGSGGTIARWSAEGSEITYVLVTDGGSGSNTPGEDLDQLVRTRIEEQRCAAEILGVERIKFLGYPDGTLQPTLELRKELTRIIRAVRPNVVLTFDPEMLFFTERDYINHPDHRAVGIASTHATFPSAGSRPIFPELLDEGLEPHNPEFLYLQFTNTPTEVVDISTTIEKKRAALRCHRSQLDDRFVETVVGWAARDARDQRYDYAEKFRVVRV